MMETPYTQGRSQEGGGLGAAALGAPPQTPGRLRRKSEAGGSAPDTRWGSAPDPVGAPPQTPLGA
ncbi:MAG: hypothetical protein GY696_24460, partial [Gammaproteobacteria bacterium]|nr:hypothetical protein [Gammaproteobacteria bacterium]